MGKLLGKIPNRQERPAYLKLPLQETDRAKRMKSAYLQLPAPERIDKRIAEMFGVSELTVQRYRRAFNWEIAAIEYDHDAAMADPFYQKHRDDIKEGYEELFHVTRELIRREFERLDLEWAGDKIIRKVESGETTNVVEEVKKAAKGKDYKELMNLFDLWVRTIHQRDPNQARANASKPQVNIDKAIIEIRYE